MRASGARGRPDPARDAEILKQLRQEGEAIDLLHHLLSDFNEWTEHETDPSAIESLHRLGERARLVVGKLVKDVNSLAEISASVRSLLLEGNDLLAPEAAIGLAAAAYRSSFDDFNQASKGFEAVAGASAQNAFAASSHALEQLRETADTISTRSNELRDWCAWRKRRAEAVDADLLPLVEALEQGRVSGDAIKETFEAAYCTWWSAAIIGEDEVLRTFSTPEHEATIERFRDIDDQFQHTTAHFVAAKIASSMPEQDGVRLDAQPAAIAPARPPAIQPLHPSPAIADTTGVRSKPAALLAAATALLPGLEAGRALDAKTLREAMSAAFGASDTQGAWVWKDAYEAAEAAMVLFIQRYGRLMRREAGAGPGSAAAMLAMLETLAALEPSQTRRSEEQLAPQQFSTPLPLAYAALQAAAIRPGDIVLEPSAGTGMLAVMAECALGKRSNGARSGNPLHLNEIAAVRAGLLSGLFAHAPVTRHNAESIADYLPGLRPTVVLMNPPFSASPGVQRIRHEADLGHIRSAFSMLPAGGRLVAITSAGCIPGDAAWSRAFERLDPPPRTVFSIAIAGRAYARRGTAFDTRLTVIDRANASGVPIDARESVPTAAGLLAAIAANVPQRQAVVPISAALVPAGDLFGHAAARPAPRKRAAATAPNTRPADPPVARRRRIAQHLLHRPAVDAEPTARIVMAQTLVDNRQTNRRIELHAVHLLPLTTTDKGL